MTVSRPNFDEDKQALAIELDKKIFAQKEQEKLKQFNDEMFLLDKHAEEIKIIVQEFQKELREEKITSIEREERHAREESTKENMDAYNQQKAEASERIIQMQEALDASIKTIENEINALKDAWVSPNKDSWVGKSWDEGVGAQAKYYAEKANIKEAVSTGVKESLAEIKASSSLSTAEIEKLDNSAQTAEKEALSEFEKDLARTQKQDIGDPRANMMLELKFALLKMKAKQSVNETVQDMNKNRDEGNKIQYAKLDVKGCAQFAKDQEEDRTQIMQDMQNAVKLEKLTEQRNVLQNASAQPKERVVAAETKAPAIDDARINHCEIKSNSANANIYTYDSDAKTRFSARPGNKSSHVMMAQACLAINRELGEQKITMQNVQQGFERKIMFEYNNQHFYFDPKTAQFSGDNIDKDTFKMMLKVYNEVYKDNNVNIATADPQSLSICQKGIEEYNVAKSSPDYQQHASFSSTAERDKAVSTESGAGVKEKQEETLQQSRGYAPARK